MSVNFTVPSEVTGRLLFFAFLVLPLMLAAQQLDPDRWNGIVPEGAVGQSISMYFQPGGVQLTLICAGRGQRLTIAGDRVDTAPSDPAELAANPRYLLVEGMYYPSADPQPD